MHLLGVVSIHRARALALRVSSTVTASIAAQHRTVLFPVERWIHKYTAMHQLSHSIRNVLCVQPSEESFRATLLNQENSPLAFGIGGYRHSIIPGLTWLVSSHCHSGSLTNTNCIDQTRTLQHLFLEYRWKTSSLLCWVSVCFSSTYTQQTWMCFCIKMILQLALQWKNTLHSIFFLLKLMSAMRNKSNVQQLNCMCVQGKSEFFPR